MSDSVVWFPIIRLVPNLSDYLRLVPKSRPVSRLPDSAVWFLERRISASGSALSMWVRDVGLVPECRPVRWYLRLVEECSLVSLMSVFSSSHQISTSGSQI